jgi:hypothetical protein
MARPSKDGRSGRSLRRYGLGLNQNAGCLTLSCCPSPHKAAPAWPVEDMQRRRWEGQTDLLAFCQDQLQV